MPAPATSPAVIAELVKTMRALAGAHPGFRAAHAKGIVCAGTFTPSADARQVTKAAHLQGGPVPVTVRFSNSSGNPEASDAAPGVRAMSMKFSLAGGKSADILANSIDGFPARTPEEFLEFLRAQLPDPATGKPVADAVPKFLGSHPGAAAFVGRLMQKPIPASYAQSSYHAEHAFVFVAADGTRRHGRYHWLPDAGEAFLTPPGQLYDVIVEAIEEETGIATDLSTSGGTSDGRFLIQLCPVVDFGLPNATMHKVGECASIADIRALSNIYERIVRKVLG